MFTKFSFLPDIDLYFDGNLDSAFDLVDSLVELRVEYLKFAICIDNPVSEKYSPKDTWATPGGETKVASLYETFQQRLLSESDAVRFLKYSESKGLKLVASVYDQKAVEIASPFCVALKISSANISNFPLIEAACLGTSNIIIDTGHASIEEILAAISLVKGCGVKEMLVQYSPTRPPSKSDTWNMERISEMRSLLDVPVGLSDHDSGLTQMTMAIALGVTSVEKGVMADSVWKAGVSDSAHCIPVSALGSYLSQMETAKQAMAWSNLRAPTSEAAKGIRAGIYASTDIAPGEMLTESNTQTLAPEIGIGASYYGQILGRHTHDTIKEGEPIAWKHLRDI